MTPRPRKKGNKDLPENLYSSLKNGKTYYQYKHPKSGKFIGLGTNKKEAIKAAIQANQVYSKPEENLADRVTATYNKFSEFIEYYLAEKLPKRKVKGYPLSDSTIKENTRVIKRINEELGAYDLTKITQADIADYLNKQSTAEVYNKHRAQLCLLFKYAVSDDIIKENLPEKIIKQDKEKTKRERLTLDQYKAIYRHARPAIQHAMELALNILQRRGDIFRLRFDDEKDGYLYIIQSKTRKHGKSAYLRIPVDMPISYSETGARTLKDLISNCRDDVVCPYMIHEKRKRRVKSENKSHMMQLSAQQISKGFAKARKDSGLFEGVEYPPTFHELISLGEHLRENQGWSIPHIQTLRGHTSDRMTRHYLDGHDWNTVEIG